MKKLSTVSLFIFWAVVTSVLTAGLVFYQNNKGGNSVAGNQVGSLAQNTIKQLSNSGKSFVLDMAEISKHNKSSDCFILVNNKVYDITSYFGMHPGGNPKMSATCGTDATIAYATRDPNAKSGGSKIKHSSSAQNMLTDYYIGDLNQTFSQATNNKNSIGVNQNTNNGTVNTFKNNTIKNNIAPAGEITLSLAEISKHNKSSDCFLLVSGKVYNITSFFGAHPGGNSVMSATCGTDATAAYVTKNPNATSTRGGSNHSSNARSMLASYLIGDINQTIGQQVVTQTNSLPAPATRGEDEDDD